MAIKAYHQREERYQGLHLDYSAHPERKQDIMSAVEALKISTGLSPIVYENSCSEDKASVYIEFHDEYGRNGGEFFSDILKKLEISCCEV